MIDESRPLVSNWQLSILPAEMTTVTFRFHQLLLASYYANISLHEWVENTLADFLMFEVMRGIMLNALHCYVHVIVPERG